MSVFKRWWSILVGMLFASPLFAQVVDSEIGSAATEAEMWGALEIVVDNITYVFGAVVVVAILVTGFFLGRRWLARVG